MNILTAILLVVQCFDLKTCKNVLKSDTIEEIWSVMRVIKLWNNFHLLGRQDGDVVLVDGPCSVLDPVRDLLVLQLLAGDPEQHVLLAVLEAKELSEHLPTH